MFGGLDPKKMQAVMKQMGIKQEEVDSVKVIIEKTDGGKILINNPNVVKIKMQGQESWQITGDSVEESTGINEEDVRLIMEKTGKSYEDSKAILEKNGGDLAQTIVDLS